MLKNKLMNRSRMQSMIIHDIRSPATSIEFSSEMLIEDIGDMIKKNKKRLSKILSCTNRINNKLVNMRPHELE